MLRVSSDLSLTIPSTYFESSGKASFMVDILSLNGRSCLNFVSFSNFLLSFRDLVTLTTGTMFSSCDSFLSEVDKPYVPTAT